MDISGNMRRNLARGAAIVFVAGVASGCSSDVMRFENSILTGSSRVAPQQQQVAQQQAYPGAGASVDTMATGSVSRGAIRPTNLLQRVGLVPRPEANVGGQGGGLFAQNTNPGGQNLPVYSPPGQQASQPFPAAPSAGAVNTQPLPPVASAQVDRTVTGTTAPTMQAPAAQPMPTQPSVAEARPLPSAGNDGGWSRAGGTQVAVKQGETVYNLSRRFGVPANAILKANGMTEATQLAAGQQVVIPTYVHSSGAPVSAPDNNPNVADAKSSTGTRFDVSGNQVPVPSQAPGERVAVLPQQPKVREGEPGAQVAANPTNNQAEGGSYTVVAGDTLNGIAAKTGVGADAIRQANGMTNGLIRIGQTLKIPTGSATVAAAPRTDPAPTGGVAPQAYTPPKQTESLVKQASLGSEPAPNATGIAGMRWPVKGRVISGFGAPQGGKPNDGVDIAVPEGTPVKAAENGVVIYAGDGLKEFGNTVLVRHEDGLVTVYGHASAINVQRGQQVRRGDEIARSGMSGSADTPKLHFEVRKDSTPVDPSGYLE